jgi:hypothetical protein
MPTPRKDLVYKACKAGFLGNIEWKPASQEVMRRDPKMRNFTPQRIRLLLRDHGRADGRIDVRNDIRIEWYDPEHPFWYRAKIDVDEFVDGLFLEILLIDFDEDEPFVQIVSAHP